MQLGYINDYYKLTNGEKYIYCNGFWTASEWQQTPTYHQKKLMAVQRDSIIPGFAHTVGYYNNLDRYLHVYNLEVL